MKFVFAGQKFLMDKNNSPSLNTGNAERDAGCEARGAVLSLESCSDEVSDLWTVHGKMARRQVNTGTGAEKRGCRTRIELRLIHVEVMVLKTGSGWDCPGTVCGKGRVWNLFIPNEAAGPLALT